MILAIDVGNTNTVLGVFDGEELLADYRVSTDRQRTADEWGGMLCWNCLTMRKSMGGLRFPE